MSRWKRIKRWLWIGAAVWAAPHLLIPIYFAITDWPFFVRGLTYSFIEPITDIGWYEPMARVEGRPRGTLRTQIAPSIAKEALAAAERYAADHRSTGLVVLHRGAVVLEAYYGGATRRSRTNGMSMVKTLIALLLGVAIEEGKIGSVTDPVSRYLPEYSDARHAITIEDLLRMTSGLRRSAMLFNPWSDLVQMHIGDDVAAVALAVPAHEPPGRVFSYNNVNSQILAQVLERATGVDIVEYLSTRLWQPLGAGDADWWLDRKGGIPKAYCCLFATARDWARVGELIRRRGRVGETQVVPAAWIDAMARPTPLEPDYGYHLWRGSPDGRRKKHRDEPFLADDVLFLDGKDRQRVYIVPSGELVIVRVGKISGWDEAVLVNDLIRGMAGR